MASIQPPAKAPVPQGRIVRRTPATAPGHEYLVYRPRRQQLGTAPIVFIHGYSRRVDEKVHQLRTIAEASGRVLVAPVYALDQHPHYQSLRVGYRGLRSSDVLDACLDDFAALGNQTSDGRMTLVGFSGGAQFAHRYLMARPERVERLVAIAAGWYTLPDPLSRFPLGVQTGRRLKRYCFNPEQFLRVPVHVIVGAEDTTSRNLRMTDEVVRMQGATRVERARRWVTLMRMAAESYGIRSDIRYCEVPGIGHSFKDFVAHGELLSLIATALGKSAPFEVYSGDATESRDSSRRHSGACHGTG